MKEIIFIIFRRLNYSTPSFGPWWLFQFQARLMMGKKKIRGGKELKKRGGGIFE